MENFLDIGSGLGEFGPQKRRKKMGQSIEEIVTNCVGGDGKLNDFGKDLLTKLLPRLPLIHQGIWGSVFVPLTRLLVKANVDLAVVDNGEVLMTWRDDEYFRGWHFPGGCLGPGENLDQAVQRIAERELGLRVVVQKQIEFFNNSDNHRSHDAAFFMLCTLNPSETRVSKSSWGWFRECPPDIIKVHEKNWRKVKDYLGT